MDEKNTITMYDVSLLHSRMDRNMRLIIAAQLKKHDITMMQWLLLETVCKSSKKDMTMSEAAEVLDVTLPQVTALMNELVKQRLLKQKVSSKDRRSRRLSCTISGKRVMGKVDAAMKEARQQWFGGLTAAQEKAYLDTVAQLAERATED